MRVRNTALIPLLRPVGNDHIQHGTGKEPSPEKMHQGVFRSSCPRMDMYTPIPISVMTLPIQRCRTLTRAIAHVYQTVWRLVPSPSRDSRSQVGRKHRKSRCHFL